MKMSSAIRVALLALTAFAGATLSSASHADEGTVSLVIYKAGWIIGGSGGGGTLNFRGRSYALSDRRARLRPGVRRLEDGAARPRQQHLPALRRRRRLWRGRRRASRSARGARAIVLTNQKGAVLELSGRQIGLMANADLSGLAITLK